MTTPLSTIWFMVMEKDWEWWAYLGNRVLVHSYSIVDFIARAQMKVTDSAQLQLLDANVLPESHSAGVLYLDFKFHCLKNAQRECVSCFSAVWFMFRGFRVDDTQRNSHSDISLTPRYRSYFFIYKWLSSYWRKIKHIHSVSLKKAFLVKTTVHVEADF